MQKFAVENNDVGNRLDKSLALRFNQFSRVIWQNQIKKGNVLVNGNPVDPRYQLKAGETVTYKIPEKLSNLHPAPCSLPPLDIIFENQDVLVINKPAGMVVHPAHANTEGTVVHQILAYDKDIAKAVYDPTKQISLLRPGIVHRLDKDTSGVMIVAKNSGSMTYLAKQIQNHTAQKTYVALLFGHFEQNEITVHNWLNRDIGDRRKMAVVTPEKGRESKTDFRIKALLTNSKGDMVTLVEAMPITGRTHQIRIHAAHLGHPVLGDQVYGSHESKLLSDRLGIKRQLLHAAELKICLPKTDKPKTFNSELPPDFTNILNSYQEKHE